MALKLVRLRLLVFMTLLLLKDHGVTPLSLVELRVPSHVTLGARAALSCRWRLSPTDLLYSVKWYKDGNEFFRHVPRDDVPRRKFVLPGVDVEKANPNGSNITLHPAIPQTGGRYSCEVSGEGPVFHTVAEISDMVIVALPDQGPTITGLRLKYRIGDRLHATCTSGKSRPATDLAWYINGEPAPAPTVLTPRQEVTEDGLKVTTLVLHFKVKPKHFRKGDLKLKCLATISTVYWLSNEGSVQRERLQGQASGANRVQAANKPSAAYHTPMLILISFNTFILATNML